MGELEIKLLFLYLKTNLKETLNMKKIFISIISLILVITCLSGCSNSIKSDDTLNVTEDAFLNMITDINNEPASYIGRTIKLEGMFKEDKHNRHSHCYVYRNAAVYDHDHGHEHINKIGLEFDYNGNMPKENDWISVVGILRNSTRNEHNSITLKASNVIILSERGTETIK